MPRGQRVSADARRCLSHRRRFEGSAAQLRPARHILPDSGAELPLGTWQIAPKTQP